MWDVFCEQDKELKSEFPNSTSTSSQENVSLPTVLKLVYIATISAVPLASASLCPHGKGISSISTNCSCLVYCCSALEGEIRVKPIDMLPVAKGPPVSKGPPVQALFPAIQLAYVPVWGGTFSQRSRRNVIQTCTQDLHPGKHIGCSEKGAEAWGTVREFHINNLLGKTNWIPSELLRAYSERKSLCAC